MEREEFYFRKLLTTVETDDGKRLSFSHPSTAEIMVDDGFIMLSHDDNLMGFKLVLTAGQADDLATKLKKLAKTQHDVVIADAEEAGGTELSGVKVKNVRSIAIKNK